MSQQSVGCNSTLLVEGRSMGPKQNVQHTLTPIDDTKSYPEPAFKEALGWSRGALKSAKDQGLVVTKVAGRNYIRGCDFSAFLGKLAAEKEAAQ
jgi:hypothetical protein